MEPTESIPFPFVVPGLPRFFSPEELDRLARITPADRRAVVERWDRTARVLPGLLRQLLDTSRQSVL